MLTLPRWILVGRRMNRGENVRKIDANSYIFILGLQNDGQGSNTYQQDGRTGQEVLQRAGGLL
jgi:hypothetical protein